MSDHNESLEEMLFQAALAKSSPEQRAAFLDGACRDNPALRARLEMLLEGCFGGGGFLPDLPVGQPTFVPVSEKPGDRIGRYKLREKIGEGGCGVVYVAEQEEPVRRKVALKIIKLGMDTRNVIARFEAERQALAMMDHPGIAKVHDAGATGMGRPYFVMELVRGIKITDYCDQNQLPTRERLELFIKVCQAVQHAHQKGIIHRDLKPSNILVTVNDGMPVPKVIDFGIAKATLGKLTNLTVYTDLHQFIGTPAYMSPEQATMTSLDIDTRSDIYSLGVLLYELMTGKTPFETPELLAAGLDEMRRTIREREPVRPSTRLSTMLEGELTTTARHRALEPLRLINLLRGDLDWIAMKCLEKDRARRYETANGLAADLDRHLNNEPVTARPPSTAYRLQKAWHRHKLAFTAATVVAVVLVLGITVSSWQAIATSRARDSEREQRLTAQAAQKEAERSQQAEKQARLLADTEKSKAAHLLYDSDINLAQQALKANNFGWARQLLDRHRPKVGEEDLRGWEWRYLWQLTRNTALVTLTNRPVRGFSVSFTPDGARLAVGWYDGRIDLWDVPDRRLVRTLTDREDGSPGHVAFSQMRNLLAATSESNTVTLYDLDSGRESILWREPDEHAWDLIDKKNSPDAFKRAPNLAIGNVAIGVHDLSFSPDGSKVVIYATSADTQNPRDAVWIVDVVSNRVESCLPTDAANGEFHGAARLSPDNQRLYLSRYDYWTSPNPYSIQCLDLTTGREVWQTERIVDDGLTALAVSPDGRVLASGSGFQDNSIRIWDAATGRLLTRLEGHTSWICKLVFTKDGRRLVSAAADQTIRFWDTATWTKLKVLRGHQDEIHALALSETAHLVASASKDGDLMLWNDEEQGANDGYLRLPENLGDSQIGLLDGSRVILFPDGKPQEVFDLKRGASVKELPGLGPWTNMWYRNYYYLDNSYWLFRWDGTNHIFVEKWNGSQFTRRGAVTTLTAGTHPGWVAFDPIKQIVAWNELAVSNSVFLATLASPERRIEFKNEFAGLGPTAFSRDGKYLCAIDPQQTVLRYWNVDTGQIVMTLRGPFAAALWAMDGRVLVTLVPVSQSDHEIRFYDLDHPDWPPRRVPGKDKPGQLDVSPDGRLVAATTEGRAVRLCDAATGALIEDLHGQLNSAGGVAFSNDGHRLIAASVGGPDTIRLWDVDTRQELLTLSGTGSILGDAGWSTDGDTILAGAPWQAWRAPSWEEIAAAEAKDKTESRQP